MKILFSLLSFIGFIVIAFPAPAQKVKVVEIQVSLLDGGQFKGVLGNITDSTIQILGRKKIRRAFSGSKISSDSSKLNQWISFEEIASVSHRKSTAPATGMWIGLGIGFIGALIVESTKKECEDASLAGAACEFDQGVNQLFIEMLLISGGAGLGALIGSAYKKTEIAGSRNNFIQFKEMVELKLRVKIIP